MPKINKIQKIIYLGGLETGFETHHLRNYGARSLHSVEKMTLAVAPD
jgi:hypothetical protein